VRPCIRKKCKEALSVFPVLVYRHRPRSAWRARSRLSGERTRETKRALWLALTNFDPNRQARVRLPGSYSRAVGGYLTGPAVNAINTIAAPGTARPKPYSAGARNGVLELQLPPASVTVARFC
jgi:alpha-L-arabinofuranosidase